MKIFGIPIKVEPSFFFISVILAAGRLSRPELAVEWVVVVLVSIILHELGHAFAARAFGAAPTITLHGMGGLTYINRKVEFAPWQDLLVSLAGPGAGFLFGALIFLSLRRFLNEYNPTMLDQAYADLLFVNIGWGLFNLVPMLPLDGGTMLTTIERGLLKRDSILISRVVSLLVAGLIVAVALSYKSYWIAFVITWFGFSNVTYVWQKVQGRRDSGLAQEFEAARTAGFDLNWPSVINTCNKILRKAQTDELKREAMRLLTIAYLESGDLESARKSLSNFTAYYGRARHLEWRLDLKSGAAVPALAKLQAEFDAEPDENAGVLLALALADTEDLTGLFKLCEHPVLANVRNDLLTQTQSLAFNHGLYATSAQIGVHAFALTAEPDAAYNTACAFARDGNSAEACDWLIRAVDAGFSEPAKLLADEDLANLRETPEFARVRARLDQPIN